MDGFLMENPIKMDDLENHQMVTLKHEGVILTIGIISYLPIRGVWTSTSNQCGLHRRNDSDHRKGSRRRDIGHQVILSASHADIISAVDVLGCIGCHSFYKVFYVVEMWYL